MMKENKKITRPSCEGCIWKFQTDHVDECRRYPAQPWYHPPNQKGTDYLVPPTYPHHFSFALFRCGEYRTQGMDAPLAQSVSSSFIRAVFSES